MCRAERSGPLKFTLKHDGADNSAIGYRAKKKESRRAHMAVKNRKRKLIKKKKVQVDVRKDRAFCKTHAYYHL